MMTPIRDRPTADLVIIALTGLIAAVVVLTLVAVIVVAIAKPEQDVTATFRFVANLTNTIVGAVIGYVAGLNRTAVNGGKL